MRSMVIVLAASILVQAGAGTLAHARSGAGDPAAGDSKGATAVPPVFSGVAFKDALEQNKTGDKLLVVKFTAEWCGPCKLMDRTTWRDQNVVAWVKDNAVALQVDVDKQPTIAQEYGVRAMPTMIAFKKGEPVDRVVGYRDGAGLLAWMGNVKSGKTEIGRLEEAAKNPKDDMPMQERLQVARGLVNGGKLELATTEYLWLWSNMLKKQPSMYGVRLSFFVRDLHDLCSQHPPAREAFSKLRDELEARLKGENKSWEDLNDWIALNEAIDDSERTVAWFDRIKGDPDARPTLDRMAFKIQPLLEERGRWSDVGRLISNPLARVQQDHAIMRSSMGMTGMDPELKKRVQEMASDNFRTRTASLYAGLLAAGRVADAGALATEAVRLDDTARMRAALVERAIDLDQTNESQTLLLEEALKSAGDDAQLIDRLKELRTKLEASKGKHAG